MLYVWWNIFIFSPFYPDDSVTFQVSGPARVMYQLSSVEDLINSSESLDRDLIVHLKGSGCLYQRRKKKIMSGEHSNAYSYFLKN